MQIKAVYCFLVLVTGCAQVPRPSTYPYTEQQQMQAAHHWRVLASQVVGELITRGELGSSIEPVYIQNKDQSPFGQAFRSFLKTELTKQGIPVSPYENDRDTRQLPELCEPRDIPILPYQNYPLKICWHVQLVTHQADRIKPSLPLQNTLLAGLGFGLAEAWDKLAPEAAGAVTAFSVGPLLDVFQGLRTGPLPHSEAIITTRIIRTETRLSQSSITQTERMLSHNSNVFYINDKDLGHYVARDPLPQKSYAVVTR